MHLHHELQRALADTKIGASAATLPAGAEEELPPKNAPAVNRHIRFLLGHPRRRRQAWATSRRLSR